MGFQTFVAQPKGPTGSGLTATLVKIRGSKASLRFYLRAGVAETLGWSDGDLLEVAVGDAEHHGLVRLRKSETGSAAVKIRRTVGPTPFAQITIGHVPAFVDRAEPKKHCRFDVLKAGSGPGQPQEDGWVEIVLPSWADETSDVKRQRVAALPSRALMLAAPAASAPTGGRLPGDPPPGRSALDQRRAGTPEPTRGAARRAAEAREADGFAAAEARDATRQARSDAELAKLCQALGLTVSEARLVACLLDGKVHARTALHTQAYGLDPNGGPEIKILDVFVSKIRRKLATRLIKIETVRSIGWQMPAESVARVMVLVDDSGPGRADDEAELLALGAGDELLGDEDEVAA